MASNLYPLGLERIIEEGLDTMTLKMALMSSDGTDYTYASTHEFFDEGTNDGGDPSFCETAATDYVQKAVTAVVNLDVANSRIEVVFTDLTWTGLGGATNETITGAILFDDSGTPTTSPLLLYLDLSDTLTTDQDFSVNFDASNGNFRIPYSIM